MANRAETLAQNPTKTNQKAEGRVCSPVNVRIENEIPTGGDVERGALNSPHRARS